MPIRRLESMNICRGRLSAHAAFCSQVSGDWYEEMS